MEIPLPPVEAPEAAAFAGPPIMSRRFRQFLPVVIDVETGGFNSVTDALLPMVFCGNAGAAAINAAATPANHCEVFI